MYTVQMVSTVSCSLKTACVVFENIYHYRHDGLVYWEDPEGSGGGGSGRGYGDGEHM